MFTSHQSINSFDRVVHVAIGTSLFTIAPYFDLVTVVGQSKLATDCRG